MAHCSACLPLCRREPGQQAADETTATSSFPAVGLGWCEHQGDFPKDKPGYLILTTEDAGTYSKVLPESVRQKETMGDESSAPLATNLIESGFLPGAGPFTSRPPYQAQYIAGFAKRRQLEQQTVVVLGDSIREWWPKLGQAFPKLRIANRGIASDTTRGMLCRLQVLVTIPANGAGWHSRCRYRERSPDRYP